LFPYDFLLFLFYPYHVYDEQTEKLFPVFVYEVPSDLTSLSSLTIGVLLFSYRLSFSIGSIRSTLGCGFLDEAKERRDEEVWQ
jgi:hypothetical protein